MSSAGLIEAEWARIMTEPNCSARASCLTIVTRSWLTVPSPLNRPCTETAQLENWPTYLNWRRPELMYEPKGCLKKAPSWSRCQRLLPLSQGSAATRTWVVLDMYAYGFGTHSHPVPLVSCAPPNVVVGCMACTRAWLQLRGSFDFSFPTPTPIRTDLLYASSREEVGRRCHASAQLPPHLRLAAVFRGSSRKRSTASRIRLAQLDGALASDELGRIQVTLTDSRSVAGGANGSAPPRYGFEEGLRLAHFGLAPRGDSYFSFRFAEVLAAGLIPIVVSDGWELPFGNLIDWGELAIVVPESRVATLPRLLSNWTLRRVCEVRIRAFDAYTRYLATPERWVAGVEAIMRHPRYGRPAARARAIPHDRGERGWREWVAFSNASARSGVDVAPD